MIVRKAEDRNRKKDNVNKRLDAPKLFRIFVLANGARSMIMSCKGFDNALSPDD